MKLQQQKWLSDLQIRDISQALEDLQSPETLLAYQLLLLSGQKFTHLSYTPWGAYNSFLKRIFINGKTIKLPESVCSVLNYLREFANKEEQPIFSIDYHRFWWVFSSTCMRLDISHHRLGVYLIRNTYAHRHWQMYQCRNKMRYDMSLTTLRYIPKQVFQAKPITIFNGAF